MLQHRAPAGVVVVAGFAGLGALLPSAMFELDAGAAGHGTETNFNLRDSVSVPTRRAPAESHNRRRLIGRHPPDFVLHAIAAPFVKAPADFPFEKHFAVLAAEPRRPPFADVLAKHLERNLRRPFDPNRFANRHFSFSAYRLKASSATSQKRSSSSICSIAFRICLPPDGASS